MKNRQQRLRASSYKLVVKLQPVKLDALLHDSLEYSILIGQF